MRILITGGTGLIGRPLCAALVYRSHDVTVLSRKPETVARKCGDQVRALRSLEDWKPEDSFDAIINLAGEPIIDKPWTESRKKALWDSRVTLTQHIVSHIESAQTKPKVFLSGSATGYYGDGGDQRLDEGAAPGDDFGARLCTAWEDAARQAERFGTRVCLLRTGLVLDPAGGLLGSMLPAFKWGLGARIGHGNQWMSWIHIDDYIAIVLRLLESPEASGPFNLTGPEPSSNKAFTASLAKVLRRPALFVAPEWVMRLGLGQRAYLLLGGQRALPNKVQALGYRYTYAELEPALKSLIV